MPPQQASWEQLDGQHKGQQTCHKLQVLGPSTEFSSFRNATTLYYYRIPTKDPNTAGISSSVRIT